MYRDATAMDVDLANLELGAINGFTDLNPFFWLCLHDWWMYILTAMGTPYLSQGMSDLIEPVEYGSGELTDFHDVKIPDPPFRNVPDSLQIAVMAYYPQLNEEGQPHATS